MSHFLYFVPGMPRTFLHREEVAGTFAAVALHDLLRSDKTWNAQSVVMNPLLVNGPGGNLGTVFAALPGGMAIDGFDVTYRPDAQTWCQVGNAWLGWYTDNPPTEASLRRERIVSGYSVQLLDDAAWVAPVIRCQPVGSRITLPQELGLNAQGQRTVRVMSRYRHWMELAEKLWDHKFGRVEMTNHDLWDAAGSLLSLNYRIGPREIDALGLFELLDPESEQAPNWWQVIESAYDWPTVQEMLDESKKNESQPAA